MPAPPSAASTAAPTAAGASHRVGPRRLFRALAVTEAVTWGLLLGGMVLKYGTRTTELGVQVFGMVHGVAFVAYVVGALVVGVDQRWSGRRLLVGLLAAVPPFTTIWFDAATERRGLLDRRWRLTDPSRATTPPERVVGGLLRRPLRAAAVGVLVVVVLTGLALLAGPPVG